MMNQETEHTPDTATPWSQSGGFIIDKNSVLIPVTLNVPTAELIVTAVNSYAELKAENQRLVEKAQFNENEFFRVRDLNFELKAENERLKACKEELSNLLATIHRDGGHHEHKVGTVQAIKDAIVVVDQMRNDIQNN